MQCLNRQIHLVHLIHRTTGENSFELNHFRNSKELLQMFYKRLSTNGERKKRSHCKSRINVYQEFTLNTK